MAVLVYHVFAFAALFSYGLYHLVSATRAHLKPSSSSSSSSSSRDPHPYAARPYHPLPLGPHRPHLLRHLPLYLAIFSLFISAAFHALSSSSSSSAPLRLASLQSSAALLLLLLLLAAAAAAPPLPPDLLFLLGALALALHSSATARAAAAHSPSDLQSHALSLSSLLSATSASAALALSVLPRLFVAELALAGSIALQGLWALQTGLALYVDGFIPEGCHRLLDVPEGSATRCDLDDSRLRAAALLDLAFVLHAAFVAVVVVVVYVVLARATGGGGGLGRRYNGGGSYEALPTSSSAGALSEMDHVQMKAIAKNSMQE